MSDTYKIMLEHGRPGGPMWEVQRSLRGAEMQLKPDATVWHDSQGRRCALTAIRVLEMATGESRIQLISGRSIVSEISLPTYAMAVEFLRGFAVLADTAETAPLPEAKE